MARFEKEFTDNTKMDGILFIATCGLSALLPKDGDHSVVVKDNATGKTYEGHGASKSQAEANAMNKVR
jgi:hypothetical protein